MKFSTMELSAISAPEKVTMPYWQLVISFRKAIPREPLSYIRPSYWQEPMNVSVTVAMAPSPALKALREWNRNEQLLIITLPPVTLTPECEYWMLECVKFAQPPGFTQMPSQSLMVGDACADEKMTFLSRVPSASILPLTVIRMPSRNMTLAPGSMVRLPAAVTVTSPMTQYGLLAAVQDVSPMISPWTFVPAGAAPVVGCAETQIEMTAARASRTLMFIFASAWITSAGRSS